MEGIARLFPPAQVFAGATSLFFLAAGVLANEAIAVPHDVWGVILLGLLVPSVSIFRNVAFVRRRIAAYIQHRIEPEVPGLKRTTLDIESAGRFNAARDGRWWILRPHFHGGMNLFFLVLFAVAWWLPIRIGGTGYGAGATAAMIGLSLVFLYDYAQLLTQGTHRRIWSDVWRRAESAAPVSSVAGPVDQGRDRSPRGDARVAGDPPRPKGRGRTRPRVEVDGEGSLDPPEGRGGSRGGRAEID